MIPSTTPRARIATDQREDINNSDIMSNSSIRSVNIHKKNTQITISSNVKNTLNITTSQVTTVSVATSEAQWSIHRQPNKNQIAMKPLTKKCTCQRMAQIN